MHVNATVVAIDLNPEFGDITGTEATLTVEYANPRWANAPVVRRTIDVSKAEAAQYALGQTMGCFHG